MLGVLQLIMTEIFQREVNNMHEHEIWPCPYGCTMLKQYIQNVETLTEENKRLRKIIDKQSEKISRLRKKNRDLAFGDTLPW